MTLEEAITEVFAWRARGERRIGVLVRRHDRVFVQQRDRLVSYLAWGAAADAGKRVANLPADIVPVVFMSGPQHVARIDEIRIPAESPPSTVKPETCARALAEMRTRQRAGAECLVAIIREDNSIDVRTTTEVNSCDYLPAGGRLGEVAKELDSESHDGCGGRCRYLVVRDRGEWAIVTMLSGAALDARFTELANVGDISPYPEDWMRSPARGRDDESEPR